MEKRVNIGAGIHSLHGWINLDYEPYPRLSMQADGTRLPFLDGSLDEIYAGHFIEHLTPNDADEFLAECRRCLVPCGKLGVMVPDTRAIMEKYINGGNARVEYPIGTWRDARDLDEIAHLFLYSDLQPSQHKWSYDAKTLQRKLEANGFRCQGEINRWLDPRVPVGAWYQTGWDATKES